MICKLIDKRNTFSGDNIRDGNIKKYSEVILNKYPLLVNSEISMPTVNLTVIPWRDWDKSTPEWWTNYNLLKHYRHNNFSKASLEHVLESLSALMILNLYFNRIVNDKAFSQPNLETSFFRCKYMSSALFLRPRADQPLPDLKVIMN